MCKVFRLLCVKGAVGASRLRDCFYNPSTTSWSPSPYTGEAKSEPLSARPASMLRILANPLHRGGSFSLLQWEKVAAAG